MRRACEKSADGSREAEMLRVRASRVMRLGVQDAAAPHSALLIIIGAVLIISCMQTQIRPGGARSSLVRTQPLGRFPLYKRPIINT
jgi:hypothetical protein